MDTSDDISSLAMVIAEGSESYSISTAVPADGLHPTLAVLVALWYSFTTAAAMSMGFAYLYKGSRNDYPLAQDFVSTIGFGIGIAWAVYLARRFRFVVGAVSSVVMSVLFLFAFLAIQRYAPEVPIFGETSAAMFLTLGIPACILLFGILGTMVGGSLRNNQSLSNNLLRVRHVHLWWLWLALYVWAAILPPGLYYLWLEVIGSGYVIIHPSLWFRYALMEIWMVPLGGAGFGALSYGIDISIRNVSENSANVPRWKRVLFFLMGTLIIAGPVANVPFRIAIHVLSHLADGIAANPWWVLR
jgi:hypothetical protein